VAAAHPLAPSVHQRRRARRRPAPPAPRAAAPGLRGPRDTRRSETRDG
jgi:hypothetical protein